jgi:hypothetical protein
MSNYWNRDLLTKNAEYNNQLLKNDSGTVNAEIKEVKTKKDTVKSSLMITVFVVAMLFLILFCI